MDFENNQGVGESVETSSPGTEQAPPVSPNEPSASVAEVGLEDNSSPLTAQPDAETASPTVEESEGFTEEELKLLPQKTADRFARLTGYLKERDTKLSEKDTQISALEQQIAESQPKSTTPSIAIDAPVDEWDWKKQLEAFPAPYREKMSDEIGWQRLPDLVSRAAANIENLPREWQAAIADPIIESIGREFGLTPEGVIQAIQIGVEQINGGEGDFSTPSAQSSRSQNSGLSRQLIESGGYEKTDPLVQGVAGLERNMALIQKENQALRSRLDNHDQQQQASSKEQTERTQRQLDTDFQAKVKATWDTVLTPILQTIPQGYEGMRRMASADAKEALASDSVAQTHLANAKAALVQAQKYRAQGTPELASQAEDRHSREMTAVAARIAVASQPIVRDVNSLIAENVRLKNGVTQEQQQRKDLIGGSGANGNGNGFQPKQPGEDMETYLARAREYRMQEIAHHDSQR